MSRLRYAALAVVVASLVLAGCSSGPTDGPTTTGNATTTEDGPPDAAEIQREAVTAMGEVDTYVLSVEENRSSGSEFETVVEVEAEKSVNRETRELRFEQSAQSPRGSSSVEGYITNGTIYQRSDTFERAYNSEWIRSNASEAVWRVQDTLERHRRVLEFSAVRLNRTERRNGTEFYVLAVEPNTSDLESLIAELLSTPNNEVSTDRLNLTAATYTYWIDAETMRPAEVSGELNTTFLTAQGSVETRQVFTYRYSEYGSTVEVTLPEGAENATEVGGRVTPGDPARAATERGTGVAAAG